MLANITMAQLFAARMAEGAGGPPHDSSAAAGLGCDSYLFVRYRGVRDDHRRAHHRDADPPILAVGSHRKRRTRTRVVALPDVRRPLRGRDWSVAARLIGVIAARRPTAPLSRCRSIGLGISHAAIAQLSRIRP